MASNEDTLVDLQGIVDAFEKMKKLMPRLKSHIAQQKRQMNKNR